MSLRSRIEYLAQQEAEKVARSICNVILKQTQQTQQGAGQVTKINSDGTVQITFPDGTQQSMNVAGGNCPVPGSTVPIVNGDTVLGR